MPVGRTPGFTHSAETKAKMREATKARYGTLAERYWEKVDKRGPDECWPWTASLHRGGYGEMWDGFNVRKAHRIGWKLAGRELPVWPVVLDHICRNRACQNLAHLRVVTQRINATENSQSPHAKNAAKKLCKNGHPFAGANLAIGRGRDKSMTKWIATRICLTCFPQHWKYAVIERSGPAKTKLKWLGPFKP